jgi:hypothetical protein
VRWGEITGTVTDSAGTPLLGVTVEIRNAARTFHSTRSSSGKFAFYFLPPEVYQLVFITSRSKDSPRLTEFSCCSSKGDQTRSG